MNRTLDDKERTERLSRLYENKQLKVEAREKQKHAQMRQSMELPR